MYVSLKDVAARSGVSFQTASKVLNGHSGVVSPGTRERILSAARELGYVPNALARGLVGKSTLTIGILADDFTDLPVSRFVVAAQHAVSGRGHGALVANTATEGGAAASVRKLLEQRVDGILVVAPGLEEDPDLGASLRGAVPAVSLNHVPGGGVPVVGSDHRRTGALAAQHLLDLGHDCIATVTGPGRRIVVQSRTRGFRTTLEAAGRTLPETRVAEADWSYAGAAAAVRRLLDQEPGLTALFVHSDVMAVGALKALSDRGVRVPEQCSLVSCDDLPFAPFLVPALTTVHVPLDATGTRAAELLLARMAGQDVPSRELLPVHLVVRDSTARPP